MCQTLSGSRRQSDGGMCAGRRRIVDVVLLQRFTYRHFVIGGTIVNSSEKRLIVVLMMVAALAAVTCASPAMAQQPEAEPVAPVATAAQVNSATITVPQLEEVRGKSLPGPVLKMLIDRELMRQEAAKLNVALTPDDVTAYMAGVEARPRLRVAGRKGLSMAAYRAEMEWKALLHALTGAFRDTMIEDGARAYFEAHKSEFSAPGEVHACEIVTAEIKDAYVATERLRQGEEFSKVASELSLEKKESGGDLGWVGLSEYHLAHTVEAMEVGQISPPVLEGDRYYIVYLKERGEEVPATFKEARVEARALVAHAPRMNFGDADYLELLARRARMKVEYEPVAYLNAYYADLSRIRVTVAGAAVALPSPVVRLDSGHLLVPLKPVLQRLDATLTWDPQEQSLTAQNKLGTVKVTVGSTDAEVGQKDVQTARLRVAPQLRNGQLFGPTRTIIEALGGSVTWDGVRNVLRVTQAVSPSVVSGGLQPDK